MSSPFEYEVMKGNLSRSQSEAVSPPRRSRSLTRTRSALSRLRTNTKDQRYERLQEPKYEMIERNDIEKMYLMTAEAPRTGSATVYLTSPYETEMAKLRMERLRIEEERLLELHRLEELEKLRPPKQKWYFHYDQIK
ncbi:hypothetical protein FSP39_012343 [Pinctada imbricata]|uniref:Uncharacterized protein n=1 Tax=Pinctada imbricata TaxID=66713 RepID=A0AA89C0N4_PINIB|nr:hypothetical protein FSP39_012343 [Pinctada imbricata]